MSIYNTLRALPTRVAEMLMSQGFMKDLSPEERACMDGHIAALVEEWFGPDAVVATVEDKSKKEKKTKTKAAVVSGTPAVIDRAYLDTRTVYELKELGKDCAAIKGRKPRAELIELVLQHLTSSPVAPTEPAPSPVAAAEESSGSDEELREEPPPEDKSKKAKKEKKEKEKEKEKEKAPKEKKEKAKPAKKEKKEKKVESKAAEESPAESEDENEVELKEWFHPSEMTKPREERERYFIDPKTNELFHPDRLQDGEPEWRWDEDTGEIVPIN